jgi:hypothetical protein
MKDLPSNASTTSAASVSQVARCTPDQIGLSFSPHSLP